MKNEKKATNARPWNRAGALTLAFLAAFPLFLMFSALFFSPTAIAQEPALSPMFPQRLPYHQVLGRVVCESDFPLDDVASLTTEINALQVDLIDYLGIPAPAEQIELCLFRDKASYLTFLKAVFPQAPLDRPALYIKDKGPGILLLQRDDRLILNLRHEMTHAFLNASLRNVPIWLDEGLAKYFETPCGERGHSNPFLPTVADRADRFLAPIPSLAGLERLQRIDQMGTAQYRDSWAWTHFLIHYSPQTQRVLAAYLQTLRPENQHGINAEKAYQIRQSAPLTTLLKQTLPDYKKCYKAHFDRWGENAPNAP